MNLSCLRAVDVKGPYPSCSFLLIYAQSRLRVQMDQSKSIQMAQSKSRVQMAKIISLCFVLFLILIVLFVLQYVTSNDENIAPINGHKGFHLISRTLLNIV